MRDGGRSSCLDNPRHHRPFNRSRPSVCCQPRPGSRLPIPKTIAQAMPICGEKSTIYSTQAEISHGLFHFAIVLAVSQDVSIMSQDHAIALRPSKSLVVGRCRTGEVERWEPMPRSASGVALRLRRQPTWRQALCLRPLKGRPPRPDDAPSPPPSGTRPERNCGPARRGSRPPAPARRAGRGNWR